MMKQLTNQYTVKYVTAIFIAFIMLTMGAYKLFHHNDNYLPVKGSIAEVDRITAGTYKNKYQVIVFGNPKISTENNKLVMSSNPYICLMEKKQALSYKVNQLANIKHCTFETNHWSILDDDHTKYEVVKNQQEVSS